jgi:sugar fermentation stimulation protein A
MNFPSPLIKGTLLRHYRRNLADVRLDDGHVVTAHVFFAGGLDGCNGQGSTVLLSDSGDRSRKNRLTWELVDVQGVWVGVNPKIAKHALLEAITLDQVDSLREYRIDDGIVAGTDGTGDILLHSMEDNCLLGYQALVHLDDGNAAENLDAGSNAHKQLVRLAEFARGGHRAIAFRHVLRNDAGGVRIPGTFLEEARKAGVEFLAYRADVSPDGVGVGVEVGLVGERRG